MTRRVGVLVFVGLWACESAESPTYSTFAGRRDARPPAAAVPDMTYVRPPPVLDASAADVGPDAVVDASAVDAAPPDAAPVDMSAGDAMVPGCRTGQCRLAVFLERCDPCPVAAPLDYIAEVGCLVQYSAATPLFDYQPADCTAACPRATPQLCNVPTGMAICRGDGVCTAI